MTERLDLTEFRALAELHGGDLCAWPPAAQAGAAALLAASAEARAALEAADDPDPMLGVITPSLLVPEGLTVAGA